MGTLVGKTTIIGEANAMALIAPMEDGMILSEQVISLKATREVKENKEVEEPIITTREDVDTAESKDTSKNIVQLNKHMNGAGTTNIQTTMHAPSDAMIGIAAKCGVEIHMIVH